MKYNKLVRDGVPNNIAQKGKAVVYERYEPAAFRSALLDKLVEEAQEARNASTGETDTDPNEMLLDELADISEVMDAIMGAYNITAGQLAMRQGTKRRLNGKFEDRIRLLEVKDATGQTNDDIVEPNSVG